MESELQHPTLCIERLSAREQEVVAAVLEDRLRSLFEFVLRVDDLCWGDLVSEYSAEELPGEGLIRSRLGVMAVLRRALGVSPFDLDALNVMRKVGE